MLRDAPALSARYAPRRLLGRGMSSEVWLAYDQERRQEVALKKLTGGSLLGFQQEFWARSRVLHEHLVPALDFGQTGDGAWCFGMPPVTGRDLDQWVGPVDEASIRAWLPGVLGALAAIHAAGFVHADLKPAAMRLGADGRVTLMDHGLLVPYCRPSTRGRGSLLYLAPEVVLNGPLDARTDLYALGALLYHLLAARPPFASGIGGRAGWGLPVLRAHLTLPPPPLRTAGVSPELAGLVARLLAKDPAERPAHAGEVLALLGHAPTPPPPWLQATPLLGRAAERERLRAFLQGPPGICWLAGEIGAGKSRLLAELQAEVQLGGQLALLVAAHGPEAAPYEPWRLPIQQLLLAAPAVAREAAQPVLARVWPQPGVTPATALEAPAERARLHLAIADLAQAAAPGAVWLLDDADRLDEASTALWQFLRHFPAEPAWRWLATAAEAPDAIPLPPLPGAAIAAALLGQPELPAQVTRALKAPMAPGAVAAMLDHARRTGALVREDGGWEATRRTKLAPAPAFPAVSPAALALAATIAPDVELQPGGLPFFDALMELEQAGVLLREGAGARLAPALAAPTPPAGADAIPAAPADDEPLPRLLATARRCPRALPWVIAAATRCQALLVPAADVLRPAVRPDQRALLALLSQAEALQGELEPAIAHLEAALALADGAAERVALGQLLQRADRLGEAQEQLAAAVALAEAQDQPEALARACYAAARLAHVSGDAADARALAKRAATSAAKAGNPALLATVQGFYGYLLAATDPDAEDLGLALLLRALAGCRAHGDVLTKQLVLNSLGNAQLALDRPAEALNSFEACRALCERLGLVKERVFATMNVALARLELGELEVARADADGALAIARAEGSPFLEAFALALAGHATARAGDPDEGLEAIAAGLALARAIAHPYAELGILVQRARALVALQRPDEAREAIAEARALAEASGISEHARVLARLDAAPRSRALGPEALFELALQAAAAPDLEAFWPRVQEALGDAGAAFLKAPHAPVEHGLPVGGHGTLVVEAAHHPSLEQLARILLALLSRNPA